MNMFTPLTPPEDSMTYRNRDYMNALRDFAAARAKEEMNYWSGLETLRPQPEGFSWSPIPPAEPTMLVDEIDVLERVARTIWNEGHDRRTCWAPILTAAQFVGLNTDELGVTDPMLFGMLVELVHKSTSWVAGFGWDEERQRSTWLAQRLMEITTQKVEMR